MYYKDEVKGITQVYYKDEVKTVVRMKAGLEALGKILPLSSFLLKLLFYSFCFSFYLPPVYCFFP